MYSLKINQCDTPINKLKEKKKHDYLHNAEKTFDKIQHPIMIKKKNLSRKQA